MSHAAIILVFVSCAALAWFGRMTIYCAMNYREEANGWAMLGLGLLGCVCSLALGAFH